MNSVFDDVFSGVFGNADRTDDPYLSAHDREQALEAAKKFCGDSRDAQKQFIGTFITARRERNMAAAGVVS